MPASSEPTSLRAQQVAQTRGALVAAGRRLFGEHGFRGAATPRRIGQRCDAQPVQQVQHAGTAIGIDPVDIEETAEALFQGLRMPAEERRQRAAKLRQIIRQRDLRDWFKVLLADIEGHTTLSATTAA